MTINAKSTKVLKSSCVILRGKIPWPRMRVWKKMTNMRYAKDPLLRKWDLELKGIPDAVLVVAAIEYARESFAQGTF